MKFAITNKYLYKREALNVPLVVCQCVKGSCSALQFSSRVEVLMKCANIISGIA